VPSLRGQLASTRPGKKRLTDEARGVGSGRRARCGLLSAGIRISTLLGSLPSLLLGLGHVVELIYCANAKSCMSVMTLTTRPVTYAAIADKANFSGADADMKPISDALTVFTFQSLVAVARWRRFNRCLSTIMVSPSVAWLIPPSRTEEPSRGMRM